MNIVLKATFFLLCILILVQIWVSHSMVNQGAKLKKIEDQKNYLLQENLMLQNAIASASAYLNIASSSASFGFSSPKAVQYIR